MASSTIPRIEGIDHVHVYVGNRARAEKWYREVLGYSRVLELESWATSEGPLTLVNAEGNVHLALFQRARDSGDSVLAFGVKGEYFLEWINHLSSHSIEYRIQDHKLSVSMYFEDLDGNLLEITTYDHDLVREDSGLVA